MILFLYLFDEECKFVLSTLFIPLYQNDQKKKANLTLIPLFDLFHLRVVVTYVEERFGIL